jgi:putative addiction module component (TIGR02574 family)
MNTPVQTLLDKALALDEDQRVELLLAIMDSISGTSDDDALLTDELKAELDSRIAYLNNSPDDGLPLKDATARVRQGLGKGNTS